MKTTKYQENDIELIVECLNNDGVIATQTDTVMVLILHLLISLLPDHYH